MRVWKLGTNWGSGSVSFLKSIRDHSLVISHSDKLIPQKNDIVLICEGHSVKALARLISDGIPITDISITNQERKSFSAFGVGISQHVFASRASIYTLEERHLFSYKLQQGIVFVHNSNTLEKVKELISYYENLETMEKTFALNQILFGPPGTGKTFHTINKAVEIADPDFYEKNKNNREELKKRFQLLLLKQDNEDIAQIAFTTFHQSFTYEDFIEGIKPLEPLEDDEFLQYKIQEGIFKKICRMAEDSLKAEVVKSQELIALDNQDFEDSHFYKMSLGDTQLLEGQGIFEYCVKNNCITIGFGNGLDFTNKGEKELRDFGRLNGLSPFPIQALNMFKNYMKIGNYVVISKGNNYIRAVGKVVGDYEYRAESPFENYTSYTHFRKVEWIFTDKEISTKEIYYKNLQEQTIYKLNKEEIKKEFFVPSLETKEEQSLLPQNPKNYVLVIDEINRGNVSSVFGELITLLEEEKRAGRPEELSVILPYSKEDFRVPQNVFVIGTMNTADRSVEALDTALRRRFEFIEMLPKPELIKTDGKLKESDGICKTEFGEIDLEEVHRIINKRIEKLLDKDHTIGHSYFLSISNLYDLQKAFHNKIIPLLQEYFFGDFGKIALVLGEGFFNLSYKDEMEDIFASVDNLEYNSSALESRPVYQLLNSKEMLEQDFVQAINTLLKK